MDSENIRIVSHLKAKRMRLFNDTFIRSFVWSDAMVNDMIQLKKDSGIVIKVKLGVEISRKERALKAAEYEGDLEKAMSLKEELEKLVLENDKRSKKKKRKVIDALNVINEKNKRLNEADDLASLAIQKAESDKMTLAERLQYNRSDANVPMSMSQDKIDVFIKEGKLVVQSDGSVTTADKHITVVAMTDELVGGKTGSPENKRKTLLERKLEEEKNTTDRDTYQYFDFITKEQVFPTTREEKNKCETHIMNANGNIMKLDPLPLVLKATSIRTVDKTNRKRKGMSLKNYTSGRSTVVEEK